MMETSSRLVKEYLSAGGVTLTTDNWSGPPRPTPPPLPVVDLTRMLKGSEAAKAQFERILQKQRDGSAIDAPNRLWKALSGVLGFVFLCQPFLPKREIYEWMRSHFDSDTAMFSVVTPILLTAALWLGIGFYEILYRLQWPIFEQFKADVDHPWPWLDPDPKVRAEWKELNKKLFLRVFLKSTLWDIPMMSLMSPSGRFDYDPETIPPWYKTLFILTFAGLLADFGIYWGHRISHEVRFLYKYFHVHHHTYLPVTAIQASYFHPLDNLFVNWYPPHFALWLFGLHVWDYWVFMIGAVLLGLDDHGGYAFPFSPFRLFPGQPSAEWHLFHHFGSGNYSKDFWDGTFKTDREYKKFLEQREKIREVSKED